MKTYAITGGIASGKSTFSQIIKQRGLPFVDCDALVHAGYEQGHVLYNAVVGHFGTDILDENGEVDRRLLGQKVFNDAQARKALDQLTHPLIQALVAERLEAYEATGVAIAFVDVPLLFETNMESDYDASILIDTEEHLQLERLMVRNQFSEEEAKRRMAAQMPLVEKRLRANYKVCNNASLEEFVRHSNQLIDQLIKEAERIEKKQ